MTEPTKLELIPVIERQDKWSPPPWFPFAASVACAGLNAGAMALVSTQPGIAGVMMAVANAALGYLGLRSAGTFK